MNEKELRRYSRVVVDGVEQAPSRAMLRAVGFEEAISATPQIGIASTWSMITPCNMHLDKLADEAAEGADASGGKAVMFNTITVSDGISMGTPGMRYSLVSREVIADSIEAVAGARGFRRPGDYRWLRQEHAGLRDGDGTAQPPVGFRLRGHHQAGEKQSRHRFRFRGGRRRFPGNI